MLKKYKDFNAIFTGRLISNRGDSIYMLVLAWYIYEVTKSSTFVGVLNFLLFLPSFFSFIFGGYIDRNDKKRLLIGLELIQLIGVFIVIVGMLFKSMSLPLSLGTIFWGGVHRCICWK